VTAPDSETSARHRADEPPSLPFSRRVIRPLVAVTSVLVVVLLLLVVNGRGAPGNGPGPGAVAQLPTSGQRTPVPVVTSLASTPATAPATATAGGAKAPSASPLPASEPPATQAPAPETAAKIPVTVLNNSRRTGLAHRVADELRAGGWPIRQTGNFTGRIRTTTVYYAPGERGSALALARQYPSIHRVLPRFAGLPGQGLTLVITRDWSG
jgi:hypothetical protein